MPKMKSHSGAKKRFKLTGSGKIKRNCKGKNHILNKKSRKRKRELRKGDYINPSFEKEIKRVLPQ